MYMKKVMLPFVLFLLGFTAISQAQLVLPNGDFEGWSLYTPVPPSQPFYEPTGGFFHTLNILDTIPTPPGITVYRCDTAHAGSYSARCVTQRIDIMSILIPGVIGNIKINWDRNSAILGEPYLWTVKPLRFQGYYKSYPVNGDSTGAILLLSKWNTATSKRDTIAYNKLIFHGTVTDWTLFDAEVAYRNNTVMPDSITILLLSCGGYNASNMFGSVGQVGSQALFDDVTLTGLPPHAVNDLIAQETSLSISPNPASGFIHVSMKKAVKEGRLDIFDAQGRLVAQYPMVETTGRYDIGALPSGIFYCRLSSQGTVLGTGSFIVRH